METFFWILSLLGAFSIMEFMAWFTHKYIMHGFLWYLHEDHHKKDHDSWFERNDTFFLFYAIVSMLFVLSWAKLDFFYGLPIAIGIFLYGFTYFVVHDIFIHQRFKMFRNIFLIRFSSFYFLFNKIQFSPSLPSNRFVFFCSSNKVR